MLTPQQYTTRWRNRWYKVFPMNDLFGVVRSRLSPAERGTWYDLRSIASISVTPGVISDELSKAYPRSYLANLLGLQPKLLDVTIQKAIELGLCTEDDAGIHIVGWTEVQSEYDRQKPYRQAAKAPPDPGKYTRGKYGHIVER